MCVYYCAGSFLLFRKLVSITVIWKFPLNPYGEPVKDLPRASCEKIFTIMFQKSSECFCANRGMLHMLKSGIFVRMLGAFFGKSTNTQVGI
jgi:hypothetical protein